MCILYMKTYHFYNQFNIGDQLFNLKFFFNISSILKQENIQINYYFLQRIPISELEKYTDAETVKLIPVQQIETVTRDATELWMAHNKNGVHFTTFDTYFLEYYKSIVAILGLEKYNICCSLYQPEDYLLTLYDRLCDKYKNLDILILNNKPM